MRHSPCKSLTVDTTLTFVLSQAQSSIHFYSSNASSLQTCAVKVMHDTQTKQEAMLHLAFCQHQFCHRVPVMASMITLVLQSQGGFRPPSRRLSRPSSAQRVAIRQSVVFGETSHSPSVTKQQDAAHQQAPGLVVRGGRKVQSARPSERVHTMLSESCIV